MIYKDFIAETAAKLMAAEFPKLREAYSRIDSTGLDEQTIKEAKQDALTSLAFDSVKAAEALACDLEVNFEDIKTDGGQKRYSDKETFFDNYVNWTKNQ